MKLGVNKVQINFHLMFHIISQENDPHGFLIRHQKTSLLECIKELIPVTSSNCSFHDNAEESDTQIDSQTFIDFFNDSGVPRNQQNELNHADIQRNEISKSDIFDCNIKNSQNGFNQNDTTKDELFDYGTKNSRNEFSQIDSTIQSNQQNESQCFDSGIQNDSGPQSGIQTCELGMSTYKKLDNTQISFIGKYLSRRIKVNGGGRGR